MYIALGVTRLLLGVFLVATPNFSAELHERWNSKFAWTRWATGPNAMTGSRIANVIVGVALIALGLAFIAMGMA